jgi:hypothetical protein
MSHKQCWAVAVGTLALGVLFGCADQGEGERCDTKSGNEDCASGLVCTELAVEPVSGQPLARCCPPEGEKISDDRCIQRSVTTGTGGSGSSSEATSEGGSAGSPVEASGAGGA